jgi:hypothetical protein
MTLKQKLVNIEHVDQVGNFPPVNNLTQMEQSSFLVAFYASGSKD